MHLCTADVSLVPPIDVMTHWHIDTLQELSKEDTTSSSADMLRHELEQAYDSLEKLASSANADQHGKHEMSQPSCDEIDRLKADLTQLRY